MILLLSSKRREGLIRVRECRDESTALVGSSTKCLAAVVRKSEHKYERYWLETYQTFLEKKYLTDVKWWS